MIKYAIGTEVTVTSGVFKDRTGKVLEYRAESNAYKVDLGERSPDVWWFESELKKI